MAKKTPPDHKRSAKSHHSTLLLEAPSLPSPPGRADPRARHGQSRRPRAREQREVPPLPLRETSEERLLSPSSPYPTARRLEFALFVESICGKRQPPGPQTEDPLPACGRVLRKGQKVKLCSALLSSSPFSTLRKVCPLPPGTQGALPALLAAPWHRPRSPPGHSPGLKSTVPLR